MMIGLSQCHRPPTVSANKLPTRNSRRRGFYAGRLICNKHGRHFLKQFVVSDSRMVVKTKGFIEGSFPEELKEILMKVASEWGDVVDDLNSLEVIPLKGAMTNEVFQFNWPTKKGDVVRKLLVRIYGEGVELFFKRVDELTTFECMSKHGQGPKLLGRFEDGRVEEFIHARTLSAVDLRDPEISGFVAAKMREFHGLDMPGPRTVFLWTRMRNWLAEAKRLCSLKDAKKFQLDQLEAEISMLEEHLSQGYPDVGFCHNDLQYGNIMLDEEERSITLIDYEYASYNPVAYDIANHFCEMAADYHSDMPHILDYSKYPGLEERRRFVNAYLSSTGDNPTEVEVEQLVNDAEFYTLANHLFWGLWGIISKYVNKLDFDYLEYARQRFEQYWLRKPQLLVSSTIHTNET
ncbi:probable choline kinase 1 isoform X2 [Euphorbia lathyris]|uniref:probable choline kinase 1 isoform X2 n=1 Tax=Euphorbia lathyris TaxID=212925 RepID=UPI0033138AEA